LSNSCSFIALTCNERTWVNDIEQLLFFHCKSGQHPKATRDCIPERGQWQKTLTPYLKFHSS
jgi:hypothetical protein